MRSRLITRHRGVAALLALTLAAAGCTSSEGGVDAADEPGAAPSTSTSSAPSAEVAAAADAAAAAYVKELRRYQRKVAQAAADMAAWKAGDPVARWTRADRAFLAARDAAPELDAVEGGAESSESYARTVEIAEHVQGFVDEHEWMAGWDVHENRRVHSELYAMSSDHHTELLELTDRWESDAAGKGGLSDKHKRALLKQVPTQLELLRGVRPKVEKLAGDDSFTPSLRDHLLHEIDLLEAVGERYVEYLETSPASAIQRGIFANAFASGAAVDGGSVANAPDEARVSLRTRMAKKLSRLVKASKGATADLPRAGDIYREHLLGLFVPYTAGEDERSLAVDAQLYWLWHIREIEDTPDEAFDNARLTIKLQQGAETGLAKVTVDSRYNELVTTYVAMGTIFRDVESMAVNKPWLIELLARPYPDALADVVALARKAAELMPADDDSPPPEELFTIGPKIREGLLESADLLDSVPRLRRTVRAAVEGTRPGAEG